MAETQTYSQHRDEAELENLKRYCIQAAKDLGYNPDYISRINKAKTATEVSRIMATARERTSWY